MFSPYLVDWENINFDIGLAAVKTLHSGHAMKVLKTWLKGWHTSSRCQATQFHPCLFGCHGARDDLHHYIICPQLYSLCKYLYRDLSQYPLDRFGLYSPGHELMVHPCCAYGAYHTLIQYVKSNHELYHEDGKQLLIRPCEKAWSVFAEAYQAAAKDFGVLFLIIHFTRS